MAPTSDTFLAGNPCVVFYVSGHGFGHATRVIEVINALQVRRPEIQIHVRTCCARWLFDLTVNGSFSLAEVQADVGVVQVDALAPDLEATLARAEEFYATREILVNRESEALTQCNAALVVADMPPLAFAASARARVPSIALGNFTWDWIYEDFDRALGRSSRLPALIRDCHALASEAWRLPMHGGFGGFSHVRDLPLVARRSRRSRAETRRAFGWPADRPVVLVSFGGVAVRHLPLSDVAAAGDLIVVSTADPLAPRLREGPLSRITTQEPRQDSRAVAGGNVVIDDRILYDTGWRYEDLVAAVDVVITKPGYGIVAECIANGPALLYTSRGRFAEYDVLVEAMPRWLRCHFIPADDLLAGRWSPHVRHLLAQPDPPERPRVDGADVAASWLSALLPARG